MNEWTQWHNVLERVRNVLGGHCIDFNTRNVKYYFGLFEIQNTRILIQYIFGHQYFVIYFASFRKELFVFCKMLYYDVVLPISEQANVTPLLSE